MTTKARISPDTLRMNRAERTLQAALGALHAEQEVSADLRRAIGALRVLQDKETTASAHWRGKYQRIATEFAERVNRKAEAQVNTVVCPLHSEHKQSCLCKGSARVSAEVSIKWLRDKISSQEQLLVNLTDWREELVGRADAAINVLNGDEG